MEISSEELKKALGQAKEEVSDKEKKKRRVKKIAGLVMLGLSALGSAPLISQATGLVARANAPAQTSKATASSKSKSGQQVPGQLPSTGEKAAGESGVTQKEKAPAPVAEVKAAAPQEQPFTSVRAPFNVASNWTSYQGSAGSISWNTNKGTINFGVEASGRFATQQGDTWFVYGEFGDIEQIKSQNVNYQQWDQKHGGIDFAGVEGLDIVAAADGEVVYSGEFEGNSVIVKHSNGYYTTYSHLRDSTVKVGQKLSAGQTLGHLGNSGGTPNPHLHFEINHKEGDKLIAVNPHKFMDLSQAVKPDCAANRFSSVDATNASAQPDFAWNQGIVNSYNLFNTVFR